MANANMTYADIMWKLHEGWTLYEAYATNETDLSRPYVMRLVYSLGKGDEVIPVSSHSAKAAMCRVKLDTCEISKKHWEHKLSVQDKSEVNLIDIVDKDISRFCELIVDVNALNGKLQKAQANFYDGGHSFSECNSVDIKELITAQAELKDLMKKIIAE